MFLSQNVSAYYVVLNDTESVGNYDKDKLLEKDGEKICYLCLLILCSLLLITEPAAQHRIVNIKHGRCLQSL